MTKKKAVTYPLIGFFLGLGAPAGALILMVLWNAARLGVLSAFKNQVSTNVFFYIYMASGTTLAFILVGFLLGRKDDALQNEITIKTHELRETQKQLLQHIQQLEGRCQNCEQVRALQDQMIQAEKLATLGKFSSALAHEINNPLMGIRNAMRVLMSNALSNDDLKRKQYQDLVEQSFGRIETTVKNLLGFARQEKFSIEKVELNIIVQQSLILCDPKIKREHVQVKTALCEPGPVVTGDPGLLQQVLLNLILNAVDAMDAAEGQGKTLTIRTLADDDARQAKLCIDDQGKGIPPDELEKIFEPFYTTKAQGTGLGLSVCHEIVKRHGGDIIVESTPGMGTRVCVSFPSIERTYA